jgi:hypothetical protein
VLSSVKQPVMLTWACDDAATNPACAGHPYFGPKGAHYFVKLTGADLLSWYERDYDLCIDFYTQVYCQKVLAFLRRHKFEPKRRKQTN